MNQKDRFQWQIWSIHIFRHYNVSKNEVMITKFRFVNNAIFKDIVKGDQWDRNFSKIHIGDSSFASNLSLFSNPVKKVRINKINEKFYDNMNFEQIKFFYLEWKQKLFVFVPKSDYFWP